jgi:hypothetical protein
MRYVIVLILGVAGGAAGVITALAAGWFDPRPPRPEPTDEWGKFVSTPKVELIGDGRLLRLTEDVG